MTYYAWFIVFAVVAYFITTDDSVAAAFYYVMKLVKSKFERWKWWLLNNPRNPIIKYLMWRRALKLAEELQRELKDK